MSGSIGAERTSHSSERHVDRTSADDLDLPWICDSLRARSVPVARRVILDAPADDATAVNRRALFDDVAHSAVAAVVGRFTIAVDMLGRMIGAQARPDHPEDALRTLVATLRLDDAVLELIRVVREMPQPSPPLAHLADALQQWTTAAQYGDVVTQARAVWARAVALRWDLDIDGARVTVSADVGRNDPDVASDVAAVFDDFLDQGTSRTSTATDLGYADEEVLGLVAATFPETFGAVRSFGQDHRLRLPDWLVAAVDELNFCVDYLAMLARAGVATCRVEWDDRSAPRFEIRGFVDLAMACRGSATVANDLALTADERLVSVTGPNSSGKTTFARAVGQVVHLAARGLPVAASYARIPSTDGVLTHFGCVDADLTNGSRLEGELHRLREVMSATTGRTLLLINELFSSTTQSDAARLTVRTIGMIGERGARCVWIGFGAAIPADALEITGRLEDGRPTHTFVRGRRGDITAVAREIQKSVGLTPGQIADRVTA